MIALSRQVRRTRLATDDPISVAAAHAVWCIGRGDSPYDVFAALGRAAPLRPGWSDAILALAAAHSDLLARGGPFGEIVTIRATIRASGPRRSARLAA